MLDPMETTRLEELTLVKRVVEGDHEAIMVLNDLGLRHIVDITQDYAPKNSAEMLKILRRGFVGYYKAMKPYLSEGNYKKHKFTTYSTYFIRKEVRELL